MDNIYAVINSVNEVRTMQSGVLLGAHLACAPLAHFCKLSVHFVNFATCTLPKCASEMQNPTFAPFLRTLFLRLMASINGVH
jgi:hypothetical protein